MENAIKFIELFLSNLQYAKLQSAVYKNVALTIEASCTKREDETLEQYNARLIKTIKPDDYAEMLKTVNTLRTYIILVNYDFETLSNTIEINKDKVSQIKKSYNHIEEKLFPEYNEVRAYIQNINTIIEQTNLNISSITEQKSKAAEFAKAK